MDGAFTPAELEDFLGQISSARELYLDLGCGSGELMLGLAPQKPHALFVGVESRYKRAWRAIEKGEKRGIENVRAVRQDIHKFLPLLPPGLLDGLYVHFPDPWARPSWRKHRLISPEFLKRVTELLKPNGFFSFKSDHLEYFNFASKLIEACPGLRPVLSVSDLHNTEHAAGQVISEFEFLFKGKKQPVYYVIAQNLLAKPVSEQLRPAEAC